MTSRNVSKLGWLAAVLAVGAIVSLAERTSMAETARPAPDSATVELEIKGMSCQSCANAIKTELEGIDGVIKATVSFERKNAVVEYRRSKVEPEQLVRKIRQIGYQASVKTRR